MFKKEKVLRRMSKKWTMIKGQSMSKLVSDLGTGSGAGEGWDRVSCTGSTKSHGVSQRRVQVVSGV